MPINLLDRLTSDYLDAQGNTGYLLGVGDVEVPVLNVSATVSATQWRNNGILKLASNRNAFAIANDAAEGVRWLDASALAAGTAITITVGANTFTFTRSTSARGAFLVKGSGDALDILAQGAGGGTGGGPSFVGITDISETVDDTARTITLTLTKSDASTEDVVINLPAQAGVPPDADGADLTAPQGRTAARTFSPDDIVEIAFWAEDQTDDVVVPTYDAGTSYVNGDLVRFGSEVWFRSGSTVSGEQPGKGSGWLRLDGQIANYDATDHYTAGRLVRSNGNVWLALSTPTVGTAPSAGTQWHNLTAAMTGGGGGLSAVTSDDTLDGDGTPGNPLSVANPRDVVSRDANMVIDELGTFNISLPIENSQTAGAINPYNFVWNTSIGVPAGTNGDLEIVFNSVSPDDEKRLFVFRIPASEFLALPGTNNQVIIGQGDATPDMSNVFTLRATGDARYVIARSTHSTSNHILVGTTDDDVSVLKGTINHIKYRVTTGAGSAALPWDSATRYTAGTMVSHSNQVWVCVTQSGDNTNLTPGTDAAQQHWANIQTTNLQAWQATVSYRFGSVVTHGSAVWISNNNNNLNNEPATSGQGGWLRISEYQAATTAEIDATSGGNDPRSLSPANLRRAVSQHESMDFPIWNTASTTQYEVGDYVRYQDTNTNDWDVYMLTAALTAGERTDIAANFPINNVKWLRLNKTVKAWSAIQFHVGDVVTHSSAVWVAIADTAAGNVPEATSNVWKRIDNTFTAADRTKLDGIQAGAQANVGVEYTQGEKTKLAGIEDDATADQTAAELRASIGTITQADIDGDDTTPKLTTGAQLNGLNNTGSAQQATVQEITDGTEPEIRSYSPQRLNAGVDAIITGSGLLNSVVHNDTLDGEGTATSPLSVDVPVVSGRVKGEIGDISQAEVEAGTTTDTKLVSALRIKQGVEAHSINAVTTDTSIDGDGNTTALGINAAEVRNRLGQLDATEIAAGSASTPELISAAVLKTAIETHGGGSGGGTGGSVSATRTTLYDSQPTNTSGRLWFDTGIDLNANTDYEIRCPYEFSGGSHPNIELAIGRVSGAAILELEQSDPATAQYRTSSAIYVSYNAVTNTRVMAVGRSTDDHLLIWWGNPSSSSTSFGDTGQAGTTLLLIDGITYAAGGGGGGDSNPPAGTVQELQAGTETALRSWSPDVLHSWAGSEGSPTGFASVVKTQIGSGNVNITGIQNFQDTGITVSQTDGELLFNLDLGDSTDTNDRNGNVLQLRVLVEDWRALTASTSGGGTTGHDNNHFTLVQGTGSTTHEYYIGRSGGHNVLIASNHTENDILPLTVSHIQYRAVVGGGGGGTGTDTTLYQGAWNNTTAYTTAQMVSDHGNVYFAVKDVAAGGTAPHLETDTANWTPAFSARAWPTAPDTDTFTKFELVEWQNRVYLNVSNDPITVTSTQTPLDVGIGSHFRLIGLPPRITAAQIATPNDNDGVVGLTSKDLERFLEAHVEEAAGGGLTASSQLFNETITPAAADTFYTIPNSSNWTTYDEVELHFRSYHTGNADLHVNANDATRILRVANLLAHPATTAGAIAGKPYISLVVGRINASDDLPVGATTLAIARDADNNLLIAKPNDTGTTSRIAVKAFGLTFNAGHGKANITLAELNAGTSEVTGPVSPKLLADAWHEDLVVRNNTLLHISNTANRGRVLTPFGNHEFDNDTPGPNYRWAKYDELRFVFNFDYDTSVAPHTGRVHDARQGVLETDFIRTFNIAEKRPLWRVADTAENALNAQGSTTFVHANGGLNMQGTRVSGSWRLGVGKLLNRGWYLGRVFLPHINENASTAQSACVDVFMTKLDQDTYAQLGFLFVPRTVGNTGTIESITENNITELGLRSDIVITRADIWGYRHSFKATTHTVYRVAGLEE